MMNDGCLAEIRLILMHILEISQMHMFVTKICRTFTVIYIITTFIVEFTVTLTFIPLLLSIVQIICITHSVQCNLSLTNTPYTIF